MNDRPRYHFEQRWRERGLPDAISGHDLTRRLRRLHKEWREAGGISEHLERVSDARMDADDERGPRGFYRFFIKGVPFYAVMGDWNGHSITVYDAAEYRRKRRNSKKNKTTRSGNHKGSKIVRKKHKKYTVSRRLFRDVGRAGEGGHD